MSPVLFNLALEKMARDIEDNKETKGIGSNTLLALADDIILLGESSHDAEEKAKKKNLIIKFSYNKRLIVNKSKTMVHGNNQG